MSKSASHVAIHSYSRDPNVNGLKKETLNHHADATLVERRCHNMDKIQRQILENQQIIMDAIYSIFTYTPGISASRSQYTRTELDEKMYATKKLLHDDQEGDA